mmetsp:Transcript_1215/g.2329  ORF Transcript_1215/g.2329 Transcript_1215/m.2329 type:complete len:152 (-) Transcript_1215:501-956(-)
MLQHSCNRIVQARFRPAYPLRAKSHRACSAAAPKPAQISVFKIYKAPLTLQTPHIVVPRCWYGAAVGSYLDRAAVTDRVISVVKNFQKVDPAKVSPTSHFINDLGLDSLDVVEVVMAFEDEFMIEIPDSEAEKIASVAEAINYIASHPQAK